MLDLAVYRWDRRLNTGFCNCQSVNVLTRQTPPGTWTPPSLTWTFSRPTPGLASKGRCVPTSSSHCYHHGQPLKQMTQLCRNERYLQVTCRTRPEFHLWDSEHMINGCRVTVPASSMSLFNGTCFMAGVGLIGRLQ